ncbi:MAG: zinc-dependent metalloprotease [Phycisphaerales bacterium]|nr:zinc-dependent metalloprotease [Phycisphaerales bacterium]
MIELLALSLTLAISQDTQIAPEASARPSFGMGMPSEGGLPPFDQVSDGFETVVSSVGGEGSMYTLYRDDSDHLLIELSLDYEGLPILIAYTVSSGIGESGVQVGDMYGYWTRIHDQLVLVQPNLEVKSTGDEQSQSGTARVFTDKIILDVPIISDGPNGGPVIDGTNLFLHNASNFFGPDVRGARTDLAVLSKAKSFPTNVELTFELPLPSGQFGSISYSIRTVPKNDGYQPRAADHRIGYFSTTHKDLGDASSDDMWVRYVNRWHLEKADSSLKMSPPKKPIVFHLEHTIPVRYRRWVRDGILEWNKAYEQIGIVNAIEVYQQDASTGAHMEKDPEDARYNFILWTNANMGFAIGPSRVDPETGQILDADIVMDEAFVTGWTKAWNKLLPEVAMQSYSPEAREWLKTHPNWDPRIRLASPLEQKAIAKHILTLPSHPAMIETTDLIGDDEYDGLGNRTCQTNGFCMYPAYQAAELAMARLHPDVLALLALSQEDGEEDDGDMLDGVPDWFIGPMLRDVIMHETGHTLGLRHNFKASGVYDMDEMNNKNFEPEAICGSVMEYSPMNINMEDGPDQGDFTMMTIGPYDYWAIEYGYTTDKDSLPSILSRVNEPQLAYSTDEDTFDNDPSSRRFDWGKNPLDYADSQIRLAKQLRATILDRMVKDGQSWARARSGYEMLLNRQFGSVSTAADWIGGTLHNRARKGDPGDRNPIEEIDPAIQRRALQMVLENAMRDDAWGLNSDLLHKMTVEKNWDAGGMASIMTNPSFPIHQRIGGMQASAISMLLNPSKLGNVYDGELRNDSEIDVLTVAEIIQAVTDEVWSELGDMPSSSTIRKPAISSLRRNLQSEHLARLVELSLEEDAGSPAGRTIQSLVRLQLHEILAELQDAQASDAYTRAHIMDSKIKIQKALSAQFTIGGSAAGGGGIDFSSMFGK